MTTTHKIFSIFTTCATVASLAVLTSCGGDNHDGHDHDNHEGHDHGEHADHEEHDHGPDGKEGKGHELKESGPNGGRVLTEVEPHLEFLLLPDHKVQITALTDDFKATAIGDQIVTVTGGDRSAPADLKFAKQGDVLVSDTAFPKGEKLPVIVQIQTGSDAEPVFARFALNLVDCPECPNKEYACVCDHDHDH